MLLAGMFTLYIMNYNYCKAVVREIQGKDSSTEEKEFVRGSVVMKTVV